MFKQEKFRDHWPTFPAYVLTPYKPGQRMHRKQLAAVLDAMEARLKDKRLRRAYKEALIVLACVQHGIEVQPELLKLAHARLTKLAGGREPPGTRRKPGVYWPIWADAEARG